MSHSVKRMDSTFFVLGCLSALIAVAAGAFGAHSLRNLVSADVLPTFETGARYQMYHALGLIVVSFAAVRWPGTATLLAGWLFVAGTILFSGSLYLLVLTGIRWLGAITPLGGVAFIVGWAALAFAAWRG